MECRGLGMPILRYAGSILPIAVVVNGRAGSLHGSADLPVPFRTSQAKERHPQDRPHQGCSHVPKRVPEHLREGPAAVSLSDEEVDVFNRSPGIVRAHEDPMVVHAR